MSNALIQGKDANEKTEDIRSTNRALHNIFVDSNGNPLSSYYDADANRYVLNTHDADVHHQIVNRDLTQHTATVTTIATASAINDSAIIVADTTGFSVGDNVFIDTTNEETTLPRITAITIGAPGTLTLDRRMDAAHEVGDTVTKALIDISSAAGTLSAPQEYVQGPKAGEIWHITNISVSMGHTSAGDFGLFGNLAALTNGVVLRARINGVYATLTNWKNNGDINTDTADVKFAPRSGGGGTHGTASAGAFKDITGAVLRLDGNNSDQFEVYAQDDISALVFFYMKLQGHFE